MIKAFNIAMLATSVAATLYFGVVGKKTESAFFLALAAWFRLDMFITEARP